MSSSRHPLPSSDGMDEDQISTLDGQSSAPNDRFTIKTVDVDKDDDVYDEKMDHQRLRTEVHEHEKKYGFFKIEIFNF